MTEQTASKCHLNSNKLYWLEREIKKRIWLLSFALPPISQQFRAHHRYTAKLCPYTASRVKLNESLFQSQDNQQDFLQKRGKVRGREVGKRKGTKVKLFQIAAFCSCSENRRTNSDTAVSLVPKPNPTYALWGGSLIWKQPFWRWSLFQNSGNRKGLPTTRAWRALHFSWTSVTSQSHSPPQCHQPTSPHRSHLTTGVSEASRSALNFLVWFFFCCIFGLDRSSLGTRKGSQGLKCCVTSTTFNNMTGGDKQNCLTLVFPDCDASITHPPFLSELNAACLVLPLFLNHASRHRTFILCLSRSSCYVRGNNR